MRSSSPMLLAAFTLAVAFGLTGCGKKGGGEVAGASPREQELQEVFEVYKAYSEQHKKGPAGLADIKGAVTVFPEAIQALRSGACIVYWNADLKSGNPAGTVLGYEKKVPAEGGWVLMKDGRTKTMTAAEFRAAPKAGK